MNRRLLSVTALLAAPLLACSDSTGPAESVAGLWVREELYQSFSGDEIVPTTIPDTLFIAASGAGRWSFGNYVVEVTPTPRTTRRVQLERQGPLWLLHFDLCDPMIEGNRCFTPTLPGLALAADLAPAMRGDLMHPGAPRRTTMAPEPPWRVVRDGNVMHVEATSGIEVRHRYRRRASTALCEVCGG